MLVEVYLTIFGVLLLAMGGFWLLIRRPVKRRWELETRLEAEQKREYEQERARREAAQREVADWTRDATETPPQEETQENRQR